MLASSKYCGHVIRGSKVNLLDGDAKYFFCVIAVKSQKALSAYFASKQVLP